MNLLNANYTKVYFQFFIVLISLAFTKIHAQCTIVPDQNTIYGSAFADANQDGIRSGLLEVGVANIGIDLYQDNNANGIIDAGEPILASTTTSSVFSGGLFTLVPPEIIIEEDVADFFNFRAWDGNNGSLNWANDWQEIGENDGVLSGNVVVVNSLRFGRNSLTDSDITGYGASRQVNLDTYQTAILSFNFQDQISVASSQYFSVEVQASSDGTSFTTIDTLTFNDTNQNYSYDISAYISSTTTIRFMGVGPVESNRNNYLYFDDIKIDFTKESFFPTYIVAIDGSTIPTNTTLTTPTYQAVSFTDIGQMSCDHNFGFYLCEDSNCAPEANDDTANLDQGESISINVLNNDVDGNDTIDPTTVSIVTQPTYGSVTVSPTGEIIYLPNSNFFGTDIIEYQVCDDNVNLPLCDTATITITVNENLIDACIQAAKNHVYYIPFSDDDLRTAFDNSDSGSCPASLTNTVERIISIKSPYPGIVIIYDHWEDGLEADIRNPIQPTTQVWGDNDPINGVAPGYPTDYIPSGGNFVLQNTYTYNPRNSSEIFYDGRDKIHTSADIAISTIAGDTNRFAVQAAKTDVYDTDKFGSSFTVPFGEDLGQEFQYTSLFIRASKDNTTINVDVDNDGTVDSTTTINEGEVHFVDGGVQSGATITSTEPVGVDLFFGGLDCYGTRQINLLPAIFYSDVYYSPVPTTDSSAPSVTYFYNNLNTDINIDWTSNVNNGTILVAAKSSASLALSDNSAYKFESQGGEPYVASQVIDSDTDGRDYDWAFNLISEERLTDFAAIAWAPGSIDNSRNDNPVWVTPEANTTLYIKFDGDLTSTTSLMSPCGIPYDQSVSVNYLDYHQIFDTINADNDQSGLAVYTCDGTKIFAVYGEDPSLAQVNDPSFDVGTTMQPLCLQPKVFAVDDLAYGITDTSINIEVLNNDTQFITNIDVSSIATNGLQPTNGSIAINADGSITYVPNTGFIGVDSFEYTICSLEYSNVCDSATVIVNISDCPTPTNKNMVFGQVFVDDNEDAINNDGIGLENIDINAYEDLNLDGIIDGGDLLLTTVTTNSLGNYQFEVPSYDKLIEEDFSSNTYSGGSTEWSGDWTEVGESDGASAGDITNLSGILRVENNKSVYRHIDLADAAFATISFEVTEAGDIDSNDQVKVEICSDNSFTNCQVLFFRADDFTSASISGSVVQSDMLTSNTHLRVFIDGYTDATEEFFIDDISIAASIRGKNILIETDLVSVPSTYALSTDNIETASFPTGVTGDCDKDNDFGFLGCSMTDSGLNVTCDDNGTPLDSSDDTISFTLNPTGVRFGGTYVVSGDVTGTGTYGVDTTFGPFPVSDGDKTITIADITGNCEIVDILIEANVSACLSTNISSTIDFDGVDDYLDTSPFIQDWTHATIMGWVKIENESSGVLPDLHSIAGQESMRIFITANRTPAFAVITQAQVTASSDFPSDNIQAQPDPLLGISLENDLWYHITGVFNSSDQTIKLYLNGELLNTVTDANLNSTLITQNFDGSPHIYSQREFTIGRYPTNTSPEGFGHFGGAIDEVRVFDSALSDDQIQRMVYQEIENNAGNVRGSIIPKDIVDISTDTKVPWANLQAYYPMTNIADGKLFDESLYNKDAVLHNITTIQPQTAPMPYETIADGDWTQESTWLYGDVWDITDVNNNNDWSIVKINNNITTASSHTNLGLFVEDNKAFLINGDNEINNSWYLELNGTIDLQDDSQLIQTLNSDLVTDADGKILRRQEGNTNFYWYNYWSSPVGNLGVTALTDNNSSSNNDNNSPFSLNMLKDESGSPILFTNAYHETGKVSTRWLYTFQNGLTYWDWSAINQNSTIQPGFGYTQKGTGNAGLEQQYLFEGKPNNGTILIAADDVDGDSVNESEQDVTLTTTLIGNPYPSALDARQFITDNAGVISGTIQLWEQWAGSSHNLSEYEGGYGYINMLTTERAYQHADIPIADQVQTQGIKTPTFYIPVGQSFFVEVVQDGNIEFNNGQRVFKKESLGESTFFRNSSSNEATSTQSTDTSEFQLIRFEFTTSEGSTRRFVLGFGDQATEGFDYGLDGGIIQDAPADDMGSILNGDQYVIQALSPITTDKVVDLTLNASGNFTYGLGIVELQNIPDELEIYLRDNLTGEYFDLRNNQNYSFTSEAGQFNERFDIVFQSGDTLSDDEFENDDTLIYVNNNENLLHVKHLTNQAKQLTISNMAGQIITTYNNINNQTLENGLDISRLSSGVYIVSVRTKNNYHIDKKVIIN